MKAILVSVDYSDLLAITLPWNRHHFEEVWVVTSPGDHETGKVAWAGQAKVHVTDAFYRDGATFNKWLALEEGLDVMGRKGWICLMDADVLWPKRLVIKENEGAILFDNDGYSTGAHSIGTLLTPRRRMNVEWHREKQLPSEDRWCDYPLHPQQREFAGYSQIFHASDPVLGPAPWHQTDWIHAGGADSFFQAKWPEERKVRPPFEVLHLGPAGQNWFGRATTLADGSLPALAAERREMSGRTIWEQRRRNVVEGRDRFEGERIKRS